MITKVRGSALPVMVDREDLLREYTGVGGPVIVQGLSCV